LSHSKGFTLFFCIHQNPVEESLIFRAEDYVYSSAADYAGEKGLLDVVVVVK